MFYFLPDIRIYKDRNINFEATPRLKCYLFI